MSQSMEKERETVCCRMELGAAATRCVQSVLRHSWVYSPYVTAE